jgi:protein SCO1/2
MRRRAPKRRAAGAVTLAVALAGLTGLVSGCGSSSPAKAKAARPDPSQLQAAGVLEPVTAAPPLALHNSLGQPVNIDSYRGKAVLVTFIYTHCPDVCPLIADQLNLALQRLGPQGRKTMRVIAVSVDPRRDTKAAVRHFVAAHALLPQFRFLTGTRARLAPVWHAYHIAATPNGKTVSHSAFEILIDPAGRGRVIYDSQVKGGDVIHDLRALGDTQASA